MAQDAINKLEEMASTALKSTPGVSDHACAIPTDHQSWNHPRINVAFARSKGREIGPGLSLKHEPGEGQGGDQPVHRDDPPGATRQVTQHIRTGHIMETMRDEESALSTKNTATPECPCPGSARTDASCSHV